MAGLVWIFALLAAGALAASEHAPVNYIVGDGRGWTTGVNYSDWSNSKVFYLGDTLTFTIAGGSSVVSVSQGAYDSCLVPWTFSRPPLDNNTLWNLTVVPWLGKNFYISTTKEQCQSGMKVMVNVLQDAMSPSPSPYSRDYVPKEYEVKWSLGMDYSQWTAKSFYFGDVFKFEFNKSHTLVEVEESGFQSCNATHFYPVIPANVSLNKDNETLEWSVIPPLGDHYYTSSVSDDCKQGMKLAIKILPDSEYDEQSEPPSPAPNAASPSEQATSSAESIKRLSTTLLFHAIVLLFLGLGM